MDKFSLIRSVYHTATAVHDTGHQMMQTGRLFTGGIEHPHVGCVARLPEGPRGEVPAHVLLPRPIGRTGGNLPHGQSAGYLGKTYDPFVLNADPTDPNFKVPDLLPPDYISAVRADRRQKLRDAVDGAVEAFENNARRPAARRQLQARLSLMSSPQAREAFALADGAGRDPRPLRPDALRPELPAGPPADRARRALRHRQHVRDGLRRDHLGHPRLGAVHRHRDVANQVAPNFDQAYSALARGSDDRGLLENTMVMAMGEFGRTPKINPAGGRDHHPGCWTILMGGGPIKGGRVIGESDELGYAPKDRPVTPAEMAATIYQGLGLDPHTELPGPQSRPIPLVDYGVEPIKELF